MKATVRSVMTRRDKLILNVGGIRHETTASTLLKLPGTRLGILAKLGTADESYVAEENEFYFDRHPYAFLQILEYYRTDELHMADNICGNAMKMELEYWGIYEAEIEACCWGNYSKYVDTRDTLANLDDTFGSNEEETNLEKVTGWKLLQRKVWLNLEYPSTSRGAKVLMFISILIVMVSILSFICESHYWFQVYANDTSMPAPDPEPYFRSMKLSNQCPYSNIEIIGPPPETKSHIALQYVEYGCLCFFALEIIIRFIFAPSKCKFLKTPLNVIDIVCIIPQAISILIDNLENLGVSNIDGRAGDVLRAVTILRTVRILRVFKLMKHYSAFKVLAYTIKVSTKELLLMVVMLLIGVMICASAVYYVERENFSSIPIALWWALVTMTTVGYGDIVPKQPAGYLIGCVCVIGGVLVIAFTVPIVVNNFTLYYSHAQSRTKLPANNKVRVKVHSPSMVAVTPSNTNIRHDPGGSTSPVSNDDNITYTNNLNVRGSVSKPYKQSNKDTLYTNPQKQQTQFHELEAKRVLDNFQEHNKQMLSEKRRQYMLALSKMEQRRKGNR